MSKMTYPLYVDEIWVNKTTGMAGKVKATFYPENNHLHDIRLTLVLKDGTEKEFPLLELREANETEEQAFKSAFCTG